MVIFRVGVQFRVRLMVMIMVRWLYSCRCSLFVVVFDNDTVGCFNVLIVGSSLLSCFLVGFACCHVCVCVALKRTLWKKICWSC